MASLGHHSADELAPNLGERLRKSLAVAGLRAADMAAYLEKHKVTIGEWIGNRAVPDSANIRLWAMRTNVPYEWLRDGDYPTASHKPSTQVSKPKQRTR